MPLLVVGAVQTICIDKMRGGSPPSSFAFACHLLTKRIRASGDMIRSAVAASLPDGIISPL